MVSQKEFLNVEICPWIETLTDLELVKELESLHNDTAQRRGTAWDNFESIFNLCRDLMIECLKDGMPVDCEFLGDNRKILAPGLTYVS